jgi:prepilin-type N-terminal cleavage/methylation domain-containing protein
MNPLHHPGSPKPPCGSPGTPFPKAPGGSPGIRPKWDRLQPVMPSRPAFTLTELLIVVAIILGLMTLLGSAVSNVRTTQKANATRDLIAKLDRVISAQIETYDSRPVNTGDTTQLGLPARSSNSFPNDPVFKYHACLRAWHIRRNLISADLPDRWTDVKYMTDMWLVSKWPARSPFQRTYIGMWDAISKSGSPLPSGQFAGAECLFMIVMQSGVANCLDCGSLTTSQVGDKDDDKYMEFQDAWGNPIDFLLWPCAYQAPNQSEKFFAGRLDDPYATANVRPTLGMRPLIYSAGPDGQYAIDRVKEPSDPNLDMASLGSSSDEYGALCGDWKISPRSSAGARMNSGADDNITNFDAEAKQ